MLGVLLTADQDALLRCFAISFDASRALATFSNCKVSSAIRPLLGTASLMAVLGIRFVGGAARRQGIYATGKKFDPLCTVSLQMQYRRWKDLR